MYLYIIKLNSYVECNDKPNIYSNKKKTSKRKLQKISLSTYKYPN